MFTNLTYQIYFAVIRVLVKYRLNLYFLIIKHKLACCFYFKFLPRC